MADPRRVLIVSFFYPPDPAVGGRRVAKFAQYLPEFGWRPTILTAATTPGVLDQMENVVATPWWSPWSELPGTDDGAVTTTGHASLSQRAEAGGGLARAAYGIARHLLPLSTVRMPDATLGWVPYAVARGIELLKAERYDALLSSFGPPSSHIVAARLQAWSRLPWIADYRDLWSENHWDHRVAPFRWVETALERRLLRGASTLTSVAPGWAARLQTLHGLPARVVYNGFDPADYPDPPLGPGAADAPDGLVITYVGTLYWPGQDPSPFFSGLARVEATRARDLDAAGFQVRFLATRPGPVNKLAREHGVSHRVRVSTRVPYQESLARQQRSAGLLFIGWSTPDEGFLTAKLFEYLGARRPILSVGPGGGPVSDMLRDCGHPAPISDPAEIARRLETWLDQFNRNGRIPFQPDPEAIAKYTRRRQTERMAEVLTEAVGARPGG